MTDSLSQPDDDFDEAFTPSLDDPELRQLEAELANRLVAQPALLDRGKILHQAGWEAALLARQEVKKQEEEQVAAASPLVALSLLNYQDLRLADVLNLSGATATVVAVGLAVVLLVKNPVEMPSVETLNADAPSTINERTSPNLRDIEDSSLGELPEAHFIAREEESREPFPKVPSSTDRPAGTLYRAGAGSFSFTQWEIEALLSGSPDSRSKRVTFPLKPSSIAESDRSDPIDFDQTKPTAFNLMREWMVHTPPKNKAVD